jgi:CRP-like cAMP-binding protein
MFRALTCSALPGHPMTSPHSTAIDATTATHQNALLAALPPEELAVLAPHLEHVPLELGMVVEDVYHPIEWIYFPETGIVSSLSVMADGSAVETATIGREGMSGLYVFHGVEVTPEHAFIQVPGEGWRLPTKVLRDRIDDLPTLKRLLHLYSAALFTLVGQNSGCNRKHTMVQRCARWILMSHDRVGRDSFQLTHHVLSQMLGVRRASVTEAAIVLSNAGAIEYTRGVVRVVNRAKLEQLSCECYGIIQGAFDRIFGRMGRKRDALDGMSLEEDGRSTARDGAPVDERLNV